MLDIPVDKALNPPMDHVRIDEGIKRHPVTRPDCENKPRTELGQFIKKYTPEQREAIIKSVPDAILSGMTTTQIAEEHGIPASTLRAWVVGNETVENARGALVAAELMHRSQEIDDAPTPLSLARAREGFRAWAWIAERRESRLYGEKKELTISVQPVLNITLKDPQVGNGAVLEGESTRIPADPSAP